MHLPSLALSALLLAVHIPAITAKGIAHGGNLHRRHEALGHLVQREASETMDAHLYPREPQPQTSSTTTTIPITANSTDQSISNFNTSCTVACMNALAPIANVTDAAGMAACYNIPYLNVSTGVFQADLRLYQVNQPSGPFTGIKSGDITVALAYPNAAISSATKKMKRASGLIGRQTGGSSMTQIQQFSFVGQVDKTLTLSKLQTTDLMALVIPSITLQASAPSSNAQVSTSLDSSSTVYFVSGVFAGQGSSGAAAAVPSAAAAAAQKAGAFVLPGVTLGIFPIGLIVTSAWAMIFLGAVGMGTIGRIRFRDSHREKVRMAALSGPNARTL